MAKRTSGRPKKFAVNIELNEESENEPFEIAEGMCCMCFISEISKQLK